MRRRECIGIKTESGKNSMRCGRANGGGTSRLVCPALWLKTSLAAVSFSGKFIEGNTTQTFPTSYGLARLHPRVQAKLLFEGQPVRGWLPTLPPLHAYYVGASD